MTLGEYFDGLNRSLDRLGDMLTNFVGVLLGFEPWLESNVIYIVASIFCYALIAKLTWGWLKGLPISLKAGIIRAGQRVAELKKCSWRQPISSLVEIVNFFGFTLATLGQFALYSLGLWLVGFVIYHWLTEIVFV